MILLSGHSLAEAGIVGEEALSVTLTERGSTAQLTPERMDGITVSSWLQSTAGPGAGTVWKVRSIEQIYNTRTPVVQLEHVIGTLKDNILFGEITPAVITGNASATTCTALQAVNYILALSSDWTLGTMASAYQSVTNAYRFNGDSLFDALERVTETLEDAWWSYDLSTYPFRLNITAKPDGVACELRAGRNLRALSRTVDKTGMYTRFYPIGKDDLHISGNFVSKNVSTYGIIEHVETDTTITTEAELTAWANRRLEKHAQPRVSITADGLELADATGVPLDRLHLGRICRMPLPEFGTVIEERIVELSYQDAAHRPEEVRITMANSQEDVTRILAEAIKSGSGSTGAAAREGARQSKADHAWIEDTDTRVALVVGTNAGGHYIKAGEIALSINNAGESEAHINAAKVYIGNEKSTTVINGKLNTSDLTANLIQSKIAEIPNLQANAVVVNSSGGFISCGGTITGSDIRLSSSGGGPTSYTSLSGAFVSCTSSQSGDQVTLTFTTAGGNTETVNFNKAAPTVVLTPEWRGNDFKVTASTGQSVTESFSTSTGSGQGGSVGGLVTISSYDASHYGYAYVRATRVGGGNGVLYRVVANANSVWNGGYNACRDDMQSDEVYTRYAGTYGGSGTTHYVYDSYNNTYIPVGTGWYTTARNWTYCYNKPAAK